MLVLIAGSRLATPRMEQQVRAAVARLDLRGYALIVGDAAGVDATAIAAAHRLGVPHFVVTRRGQRPRHTSPTAVVVHAGCSWTDRDRAMIRRADLGYFVWNGRSRGTREGYAYMRHLDKTAWLWTAAT